MKENKNYYYYYYYYYYTYFCIDYIPLCGLLQQGIRLCWCSIPSLVRGCSFQIPGKNNTHVGCGLIYVERPNCHNLGMEVEHVLCLQLLASQLTGTSPCSLVEK